MPDLTIHCIVAEQHYILNTPSLGDLLFSPDLLDLYRKLRERISSESYLVSPSRRVVSPCKQGMKGGWERKSIFISCQQKTRLQHLDCFWVCCDIKNIQF